MRENSKENLLQKVEALSDTRIGLRKEDIMRECRCPECVDVEKFYAQKYPQDLRRALPEDIGFIEESLFLLSPKAFHYFLPEFIRFAVLHPTESDLLEDRIVFKFTPFEMMFKRKEADPYCSPFELKEFRSKRSDSEKEESLLLSYFSDEDLLCVIEYFKFLLKHDPADWEPEGLNSVIEYLEKVGDSIPFD